MDNGKNVSSKRVRYIEVPHKTMNGKNMLIKRVKYIEVPQKTKKELARKFGCVRSTVHRALNMEMDTPLGNEIRRAAMEMGGVFAMKVKFIEC